MSQKRRSRKKVQNNASQSWGIWAVAAAALVLVVAGLALLFFPPGDETASGTPDLVIEQTEVDEGYQTYSTPVRTLFTLRNEGDGSLRILGDPQVQLVEGCWPPQAVVGSTTIEPGEETELYLDYTMTEGMGGPHRFDVKVRTNDPDTPELVLVARSDWGP